jgi:phage portal protein BeeE
VLDDPSDYLTGRALWKLHSIYLDLVGDSFFLLNRRGTVITGLWPIPPTWVQQLPDTSKPPTERTYRIALRTGSYEIPAANMIHIRNHDPLDPLGRGVGAGFALGDELDTDEYAARFSKNLLYNNALPGAIVGVKGMPGGEAGKDSARAFKESLVAEHGGPDRAGRIMVTPAESVSIARLDTKLTDMQFVEMRKFLQGFIRMTYGVPPEVLGDISNSNKATAYAAREILAEQVIEPRIELLRSELQKRLVPFFGDDLCLDYDSVVPADRDHQLAVMQSFREAFTGPRARRGVPRACAGVCGCAEQSDNARCGRRILGGSGRGGEEGAPYGRPCVGRRATSLKRPHLPRACSPTFAPGSLRS